MSSPAKLISISKYLSKHLRHRPDRLGLVLEPGGWVAVDVLLEACCKGGQPITRDVLAEVVEKNDKQRFSFDASGKKIRANQGHSVDVDLELEPQPPPSVLYHGSAEQNREPILRSGLLKMARHHVHLSADVGTATKVGARHGKPIVFVVATNRMVEDGAIFYRSDNGVWLTDAVAPQYLGLLSASQ